MIPAEAVRNPNDYRNRHGYRGYVRQCISRRAHIQLAGAVQLWDDSDIKQRYQCSLRRRPDHRTCICTDEYRRRHRGHDTGPENAAEADKIGGGVNESRT